MDFKYKFPEVNLDDFSYNLPDNRIAQYPLSLRDQSKLLVYQKGILSHHLFRDLRRFIPEKATLFFNDTKVIPARIHFKRPTGAVIEIFILRAVGPTREINKIMETTSGCTWECMIGNAKKWKEGEVLENNFKINGLNVCISAKRVNGESKTVRFSWTGDFPFSVVLNAMGKTPLPPYIKRDASEMDKDRYQTIFALNKGAVAAPTAGLHFDPKLLQGLKSNGVAMEYLTLHVSTGTFQPITSPKVATHPMHAERVFLLKKNLEALIDSSFTIAVGTTSLRTLESLYWFGVKLMDDRSANFYIEKNFPYRTSRKLPEPMEAIQSVYQHMVEGDLNKIEGVTEILVVPGYAFRIVNGLITNFHMPGSTLILLVAAFIGSDWQKVYDEALNKKYRFLSYGDASLLLP